MKNFFLACLAFLVWALFGAWIHNGLNTPNVESVKVVKQQSKVELKPKPILVIVPKDTTVQKSTIAKKDSVVQKEVLIPKVIPVLKEEPKIKESVVKTATKLAYPEKTLFLKENLKSFSKYRGLAQFIRELKAFLKENKNAQVYVVGHTDTIGDKQENYGVGLVSARDFKDYLISRGIYKRSIHISSKGELEPYYSKSNTNSRIEITVKPN